MKRLCRTGHVSAAAPYISSRKKRSEALAWRVAAEVTAVAASSTARASSASSPSAARSAQRITSTRNSASARASRNSGRSAVAASSTRSAQSNKWRRASASAPSSVAVSRSVMHSTYSLSLLAALVAAAFCFAASVWLLWTQEPSTSRTMVDKPIACRSLFAIYSWLPVCGVRVGLVRIGATVDAPKMPTPVHAVL